MASLRSGTEDDLNEVLALVEKDRSVFPFNEYENLICNLIEKGGLTYDRGFKFQVQQLVKSWSGRIPHTVS